MTQQSPSAADRSAHPALWQFVAPHHYVVPAGHVQKDAARAWLSLQQIFRRKVGSDAGLDKGQHLHALSAQRLAQLMPALPWEDAAAALEMTLQGWPAAGAADSGVKFVIGQPFSGHAPIVSLLGARHQAVEIPLPSLAQILSNDIRWFDCWPAAETFWVLPKLEHCYLRHATGLDLLRRLLSLAASGQLGNGMIGCDSWAWAYVQRIFPCPQADAITLQAFDAERLQWLLYSLMQSQSRQQIHCYNAQNSQEILIDPSVEERRQKEFVELASHCRGNIAVATAYWRERLRCGPNELDATGELKTALRPAGEEAGEHIWVAGMPADLALPAGNEEEFFLLLHAMLLHDGLPEPLLGELLPLSAAHSRALLEKLRHAAIVDCVNGRWQVRELAYPTVRRVLSGRDYLSDSF